MATFTAVYDACVLYPAPLRDLLMHLAMSGIFRARWTERIHDEWIRSVLANRPDLRRDQLERTRRLMNAHVLDSVVVDYEDRIEGLFLPDPDDRHVLAAAIASRASVIVTFNLDDFPKQSLKAFGVVAQHPDAFLIRLLDLNTSTVHAAVRRHRQSLKNPPKTAVEYLDTLLQQQLPHTAARLYNERESI